jgi:uncharacterized membrane protein HdeD (DUF308 family)
VSTLFLVAGLWMVRQLASGPERVAFQVASLVLAIGVVFLIEGAVATVVAISHRQIKGWGWGLTNGVVTLVLGLMILRMKSLSLLWGARHFGGDQFSVQRPRPAHLQRQLPPDP